MMKHNIMFIYSSDMNIQDSWVYNIALFYYYDLYIKNIKIKNKCSLHSMIKERSVTILKK